MNIVEYMLRIMRKKSCEFEDRKWKPIIIIVIMKREKESGQLQIYQA
mgnify:CR=1 FL=1